MSNQKTLRPWKKGQSGNPEGSRRHNQDAKRIKKLTMQEVAEVVTLILDNDLASLQKLAKEPGVSVLKVWTAAIAAKAIPKGDATAFNALLNRVIGPVKERVEHTGPDGMPLEIGPRIVVLLPPKNESE